MNNKIIKIENLCKTYISGGMGFNAIKNLTVEINEKEFTVIMGSSGSGKSTLLYLLSGNEKTDKLLRLMEMEEQKFKYPSEVSGGAEAKNCNSQVPYKQS